MSIFRDYAQFYDQIYADKNHIEEADFVLSVVREFAPKASTLLDLGCGTGRHHSHFRNNGLDVWGMDQSAEMIKLAQDKSGKKDRYLNANFENFKLQKKFDAVVSLFHVLSYQTQEKDIQLFFDSIASHLNQDGVAIVDYWYGPAVLKQGPSTRSKDFTSFTRHSSGNLVAEKQLVEVDIKLDVNNHTLVQEKHSMRYFFLNELDKYLDRAGLVAINHRAWPLTNKAPNDEDWTAYMVLKKKSSVSIVLPTYNEKENICILIDQILAQPIVHDYQILISDDDSPDLTWKIVEERYAHNPNVKVIRRLKDHGLVSALNEAISLAETEYVLWMDADLQMPADKLPILIDRIIQDRPSAVLGSRFISEGSDVRDHGRDDQITAFHRFLSWILSKCIPKFLDLPYTDVTSGFIIVRKDLFNDYKLVGVHGEYFIHLLHWLHHEGHRVIEIPYRLGPRQYGVSKSTNGNYWHIFKFGLRYLFLTFKLKLKGR